MGRSGIKVWFISSVSLLMASQANRQRKDLLCWFNTFSSDYWKPTVVNVCVISLSALLFSSLIGCSSDMGLLHWSFIRGGYIRICWLIFKCYHHYDFCLWYICFYFDISATNLQHNAKAVESTRRDHFYIWFIWRMGVLSLWFHSWEYIRTRQGQKIQCYFSLPWMPHKLGMVSFRKQ